MDKDKQEARNGLAEIGVSLDELGRRGARQVIQQAVEVELTLLLERYENVKTLRGQRAVVRNGYLPEREVLTGVGPVRVKVPKVRDRAGSGVKFNSALVPPYVRRSPRVSAALPWLYLEGISTGEMSAALQVLLGEEAKGLSANVVSRLKAQWSEEHSAWDRRDLTQARYVYWWADGIHTGLRSEQSTGQCLLVIIGVTPEGRKERVAIADGFRESKESWQQLLLDLKARGLKAGPLLATGDGAMGFWAALEEVFPSTCAKPLLVSQDGQRTERITRLAASAGQGGLAGAMDGGHTGRGAGCAHALCCTLPGEVSASGREAREGPRQPLSLL